MPSFTTPKCRPEQKPPECCRRKQKQVSRCELPCAEKAYSQNRARDNVYDQRRVECPERSVFQKCHHAHSGWFVGKKTWERHSTACIGDGQCCHDAVKKAV